MQRTPCMFFDSGCTTHRPRFKPNRGGRCRKSANCLELPRCWSGLDLRMGRGILRHRRNEHNCWYCRNMSRLSTYSALACAVQHTVPYADVGATAVNARQLFRRDAVVAHYRSLRLGFDFLRPLQVPLYFCNPPLNCRPSLAGLTHRARTNRPHPITKAH
jgi:hypothetical protein